jgi:hypothetical protein
MFASGRPGRGGLAQAMPADRVGHLSRSDNVGAATVINLCVTIQGSVRLAIASATVGSNGALWAPPTSLLSAVWDAMLRDTGRPPLTGRVGTPANGDRGEPLDAQRLLVWSAFELEVGAGRRAGVTIDVGAPGGVRGDEEFVPGFDPRGDEPVFGFVVEGVL